MKTIVSNLKNVFRKVSIVFSIALGFLWSISSVSAQNRVTLPNGQQVFLSGMNIAWQDYANDVADTPINAQQWATILDNIRNAGGNSIRWWLYTNASRAPRFTNGLVSGLGTHSVQNIRTVLDLAQERNMLVILCLFSFDLLQTNQYLVNGPNNMRMLTTDEGQAACINNCIVPTVSQIGMHPAIACWEIFNEPEGMLQNGGWTTLRLQSPYWYQRFINRATGAIHRAVPGILVSSGAKHFHAMSNVNGWTNTYSDQALIAAGGDRDGTLDFYMKHYYDNEGPPGTQHSPFHHNPSHWGLDKPIVVAEFGARGYNGNFTMSGEECFRQIYNRGYAGALSWTYTNHDGFGGLAESTPGMRWIATNHPSALVYDAQPEPNFGTNRALNRTVTVSSTEAAPTTNIARNVVDGSRTSRWSSAYADNQWLVIDLGSAFTLSNMVIRWEAAFARNYSIQVSGDNQNWTTIRTVTNGDGGRDILTNLSGAGRYVRLQLTTRATVWGFSAYEIEVFGEVQSCTASITNSGNTNLCAGGATTLTASSAASYVWRNGASSVGTTPSITASDAGSYTVQITTTSGCVATSTPVVLTVQALPTVSITPNIPPVIVQGQNISLTAVTNAPSPTFAWFRNNTIMGSTSSALSINQSGSYQVRVTSGPCEVTSTAVTVRDGVLPTVSLTSPMNNTTYQPTSTIWVEATANDTDGSIARVEVYQDNIKIADLLNSPYQLNVGTLSLGTYAFHVVAVDNDGLRTTSSTSTIQVLPTTTSTQLFTQVGLKAYPNPFTSNFLLDVPSPCVYTIWDTQGVEVAKGIAASSVEIGSTLISGLYVVQVELNGQFYRTTITKQ
ncbi:MAG: discoidin domain-containing protein [Cytophagaceae bacterium]|jgi:hypothetical protein|nr:discoidin domain-containing protein [Cytophagaceae bacterium]